LSEALETELGLRKTFPCQKQTQSNENQLAEYITHEKHQNATRETIAVQADSELICSKPTPGGDDIATYYE
jgi:hypothetical protein